ncbi:MetQ/NlpA family ABC transporter substrate-binding protein [Kerstersia similis]|uniref:MetQ/NlpA family ABC transporter substrate-binding protein n=1 Tax=Kerstersia similis TaxID=206505 RepID=UPI0039F11273
MLNIKKTLWAGVVLTLGLAASVQAQTTVRLGISGGVMEDVAEAASRAAAREGLIQIKPVVFTGHLNANGPLNDGDLDANAFQHEPYLRGQTRAHGYALAPVAHTLSAPLGIYSRKYKSLNDLPEKALVGIPGDDTNRNRALLLLQHYGLISLRPDLDVKRGDNATTLDIVANPRQLEIREIDSLILARALDDVDAGAIITAEASQAGLLPARDAIALEPPGGPYANVLVVRERDRGQPWVAPLTRAFQSDEVRELLRTRYSGTLLPAF